MMHMNAMISSRWMKPPATCSENPSIHNTKRTTTTVQIKLTMTNLHEMISCYLIAPISYYRRVQLVSTGVVVARTRAWRRLSAARLAGMATTGPRRETQALPNQPLQFAPERHALAEIGHEGLTRAPPLAHHPTPASKDW